MTATPIAPSVTLTLVRAATDAELVALLATNPSAAVGEMHRRFAAKLRACVAHDVGAADADDVVQDVFVAVLQEARFHPAPERLYPWLSGIARRLARARKEQLFMESLVPSDAALCDPWLEEIDGPEPPEGGKKRRRRLRR